MPLEATEILHKGKQDYSFVIFRLETLGTYPPLSYPLRSLISNKVLLPPFLFSNELK